jgi:N-acetylglutamate synthase-like GNAT family acetyltransferase
MTTRSLHWFYENGYQKGQLKALPADRQKAVSSKRNSRILIKKLA